METVKETNTSLGLLVKRLIEFTDYLTVIILIICNCNLP